MTLEEAVKEVRRVGSLTVIDGAIHYEIRKRAPSTSEALETLRAQKSEALAILSGAIEQAISEPLEPMLKGKAVELWCTSEGRLFLVADNSDAQSVSARFGARRGEIFTAEEARQIVTVGDPEVVAEICAWKRQLDGSIRSVSKSKDRN